MLMHANGSVGEAQSHVLQILVGVSAENGSHRGHHQA
jgi:hypothetical protein